MSNTSWHDPAAPDPFSVWHGMHDRVARLLRQPLAPGFAQELDAVTEVILQTVDASPEASLFEMIYGEEIAGYAIAHALQTAFTTAWVAQRMGWSILDRQTLVKASLTMNIAMLDLQDALVRQPTPPSIRQRQDIDTHAQRGRAMLEAAGIGDAVLLHTVAHHHVTDGGRTLPADRSNLSPLACLVHYADVYLARLSPRATRAALAINVAARELHASAGGNANPYATAIVQEMGNYPPGTFVKLRNGDTAIVLRRGTAPDTPLVSTLLRADGTPYLMTQLTDTSEPDHKVVAALPRGQVMLTLNRRRLYDQAQG
ncbi:HD-GYP domain-containing protein [Aquabacterium parvum]|uniref:HD-GYP domain-containing protein n=1 Tax=Aquabacterium parvum TaxID=70584 RepID=UPI000718E673|nr:hypothetical protein [Aquabacterium parvum]MBU0917138.1 hypothetical protein [Gammaproteobacteria bacterium]